MLIRPEKYSATHSKNCIFFCAKKVAHGLDLISCSIRLYFLPVDKHVKYSLHLAFSTDKVKILRNLVQTLRSFYCAITLRSVNNFFPGQLQFWSYARYKNGIKALVLQLKHISKNLIYLS